MNWTDARAFVSPTHLQRPMLSKVRITKSICRNCHCDVPTSAKLDSSSSQVKSSYSNVCLVFFPQSQTKMLEVHLVHPIQNEVSAHQIVLDSWSHKVLLSSCFNINYISLFCLAGCSHSFAHNVSILSFPAPPIMHSQFDKGFSYRKNFVWTKHIAEKGNV